MRRLIVALVVVVVVVVAVAWTPLLAGGLAIGDGTTVGGQIRDGSPEAVVVVGRSGTVGSWEGQPHGGAHWTCGYYTSDLDPSDSDGGIATVHYDDGPVDPEPGQPYVLACTDQSGRRVRSILQVFDPADPLGGIAATERALDEARRRLDLPLPQPALNPPAAQLVGVPTWLWVDGPWAPSSATASVGAVAATVTARPVEVTWDTGDGTTTTCDAGTPYDPARRPGDQHSGCTHVFTRSSATLPGGTYAVVASVSYEVSWSASTGAAGDLGTLTRSTTIPVRVTEAQALIR
jgi:hypothetical protein